MGNKLMSYQTILQATQGDAVSINEILKHFGGYITTLSLRETCDSYGNTHRYVDESIKQRLETKLITKILVFKAH